MKATKTSLRGTIEIIYNFALPVILYIILAISISGMDIRKSLQGPVLLIVCTFLVSALFKYGYIISTILSIAYILILSVVLWLAYQNANMKLDPNFALAIVLMLVIISLGVIAGFFTHKRFSQPFVVFLSNRYFNKEG